MSQWILIVGTMLTIASTAAIAVALSRQASPGWVVAWGLTLLAGIGVFLRMEWGRALTIALSVVASLWSGLAFINWVFLKGSLTIAQAFLLGTALIVASGLWYFFAAPEIKAQFQTEASRQQVDARVSKIVYVLAAPVALWGASACFRQGWKALQPPAGGWGMGYLFFAPIWAPICAFLLFSVASALVWGALWCVQKSVRPR